jgi:hypothetical protein
MGMCTEVPGATVGTVAISSQGAQPNSIKSVTRASTAPKKRYVFLFIILPSLFYYAITIFIPSQGDKRVFCVAWRVRICALFLVREGNTKKPCENVIK